MPETHMLKPFRDRYESMRALVDDILDIERIESGVLVLQLGL